MPPLILRYAFVSPSLQVRFKSVSSPFITMGLTWDLQGTYIGVTWQSLLSVIYIKN